MSFVELSQIHTYTQSIWLTCRQSGVAEFPQDNLSRQHVVPLPVDAFVYMFGWIMSLDKPPCSHLILDLETQHILFQVQSFQLWLLMSRGRGMDTFCSLLCSQDTGSSLLPPPPSHEFYSLEVFPEPWQTQRICYQWTLNWCFSPHVKFILSICCP